MTGRKILEGLREAAGYAAGYDTSAKVRVVYWRHGQPKPYFTRNDLVVVGPSPCPPLLEGVNVMEQKALTGPPAEDVLDWLRDPDYAGPMQHLRDWGEIDRMHSAAADEIEALRDGGMRDEERARIVAWHRAQAVAMRAEAARTGGQWHREKCEARAECYEHAADAIERQDHAL